MSSAVGPIKRLLHELLSTAFAGDAVQVAYRLPAADKRANTLVALGGYSTSNATAGLGPEAALDERPSLTILARHYDPRAADDADAAAVEARALDLVDTVRAVVRQNRNMKPAGAARGLSVDAIVASTTSAGPTEPENPAAPGLVCDIEITVAIQARRT